MLVRLMYASRASDSFAAEDMPAILRKSKTNNPSLGITGLLCFSNGIFLQVLEGGRLPVSKLYNKIAGDQRHQDVMLLKFDEISERSFAGWSMGQVNMSRLNPALLLKYSENALLDPYASSGDVALALCQELVATASVGCPT